MTQPHDDLDARFDALLRDLGPDVPRPQLDARARGRLMATILPSPAAAGTQARRVATLAAALAAALAVACAFLAVEAGRSRRQADAARWRASEAMGLLAAARSAQRPIPAPDDVAGIRRDDLVLLAFDHELCPFARACMPRFRELQRRSAGGPERFVSVDLTGERRDDAARTLHALGLDFALDGPPGAETGVVKVLDMATHRVLCSAPGVAGVEQAERLLMRVSSAAPSP